MSIQHNAREQLLRDGYCRFEQVLDEIMLAKLTAISNQLLDQESSEMLAKTKSQGSMIGVMNHPFMAELIAYRPALEALQSLGFGEMRFQNGYLISKPPQSPRLFWHQDHIMWEDPTSFREVPHQLFVMYYLTDTTRENGCLRVIPGSHLQENELHYLLQEAHSDDLAEVKNPENPAFSTRPDEVDVPVRAGDLLVGDARLLHAAHANTTANRRSLVTLWYNPWDQLEERTQALAVKMSGSIPADWPAGARQLLEPLMVRYEGSAAPYPVNRKRPLSR